jgi:sporulation protein YlmC with PRC-barrel domain
VRRGARVEALDGLLGHLDKFVVDPDTGHVTDLLVREGHLWGQKEITIPVAEIDRIQENTVYLSSTLDQVHHEHIVPRSAQK